MTLVIIIKGCDWIEADLLRVQSYKALWYLTYLQQLPLVFTFSSFLVSNRKTMASMVLPAETSRVASLLSLPAELRWKIWDLCIPRFKQIETEWGVCGEQCINTRTTTNYPDERMRANITVCTFKPLLSINHQIRSEVLQLPQLGVLPQFTHHSCFVDFLAHLTKEEMEQVRAVRMTYFMRLWTRPGVEYEQSTIEHYMRVVLGDYFEDVVFEVLETRQQKGLPVLELECRTDKVRADQGYELEAGC
jgi:hypothetical protein